MIVLYKLNGPWKTETGLEYDVKLIEASRKSEHLSKGWADCLEKLQAVAKEETGVDGGEYERELRDKIKALGGKPGGRSSIERLESQLAKLEAEHGHEASTD